MACFSRPPKRRVVALKLLQEMSTCTAKLALQPVTTEGPRAKAQPIVVPRLTAAGGLTKMSAAVGSFQDQQALSADAAVENELSDSWKGRRVVHNISREATVSTDLSTGTDFTTQALQAGPSKQSPPESKADEIAWRHRFVRKWRKEQNRPCTYCHDDLCDDPWHAALQLLQAATVHPDLEMPLPDHDCYGAGGSALLIDNDTEEMTELGGGTCQLAECTNKTSMLQIGLAEAASSARQLLKHQVSFCVCFVHIAGSKSHTSCVSL